jgi:dCTP deaminase
VVIPGSWADFVKKFTKSTPVKVSIRRVGFNPTRPSTKGASTRTVNGLRARATRRIHCAAPVPGVVVHSSRNRSGIPSMAIQSDRWIKRMALDHGMIEPFEDRQVRQGVISYGVSSYGYDMRVAREFRIFTNVLNSIVDPKAFDPKSFVEFEGDVCIVPPNSFALARSVEYFRIPRDVVTICVGKSTYARCGIITNVTPFEPEWEGFVTLEISNTTPLPAKIYANEGIAQVLFFKGEEPPEVSYKDKAGKYQGQTGVTLPKL